MLMSHDMFTITNHISHTHNSFLTDDIVTESSVKTNPHEYEFITYSSKIVKEYTFEVSSTDNSVLK